MPVIPAFKKLKLEVSLDYTVRTYLKKTEKKKKREGSGGAGGRGEEENLT
jgi:hypothetical protein